jgi:hypothetical protein
MYKLFNSDMVHPRVVKYLRQPIAYKLTVLIGFNMSLPNGEAPWLREVRLKKRTKAILKTNLIHGRHCCYGSFSGHDIGSWHNWRVSSHPNEEKRVNPTSNEVAKIYRKASQKRHWYLVYSKRERRAYESSCSWTCYCTQTRNESDIEFQGDGLKATSIIQQMIVSILEC